MESCWKWLAVAGLIGMVASAMATKATSRELARAKVWAKSQIVETAPFSFALGGEPSSGFLKTWGRVVSSKKLDGNRTERRIDYTNPRTGLAVACIATEYRGFPVVEWTLRFKNTGREDTPVLSHIRPLDLRLKRKQDAEFLLHWNTGDNCTPDSYEPHANLVLPGTETRFASSGGRPTTGDFPYWNVEFDGGGQIVVLSWAGQWSAAFVRDNDKSLRVQGGQELTHFVLRPGEEVSSPLAITLFYEGDWLRAQNLWRRWMLAYNLPKPGGNPPKPFTFGVDGEQYPGLRTDIEGEKKSISLFHDQGIKLDAWDQDAGWYPCGDAWWNTGDWRPDPIRFPNGMKELGDFLHSKGIKFMLWNEPERATGGSPIVTEHPDWFYGGKDGGLIKLGEPQVWNWMVEHFDSLIKASGVDIYRQDFNMGPLDSWRGADAPDRQGISEIRHVEGYYAYWDELLRRNPGLLIDSCASGGRRNNVQTLRRSVPVLRSDYTREPVGNQGHTYGLSLWIPFHGTGQYPDSAYHERSSYSPIFGVGADTRLADPGWELIKKTKKEWSALSQFILGDFYPLTPYSLDNKNWIAYQYDVPEKGRGMVMAFRRDQSRTGSMKLRMFGLEAAASYDIEDLDSGLVRTFSGADLMNDGLTVRIGSKPGSAMLAYRRKSDGRAS